MSGVPYFVDNRYVATPTSSRAFRVDNILINANGGVMDNVQVEYINSPPTFAPVTYTKGSWSPPTISGLKPYTDYIYRVRTHNNYGWSEWGPWRSVRTLADVPDVPELGLDSAGQISLELTAYGKDNGSPIISWDVAYQESGTGAILVVPFSSKIILTNLKPGTEYEVSIRAKNAIGYSAYSSPVVFTTKTGVWINVLGTWKQAIIWINVGGVWKKAVRHINVDSGITQSWKK